MKRKRQRRLGMLTAGGDCPGLNAAIRAVAKTVMHHDIEVVGFYDGFRGLAENRFVMLDDRMVSGILTTGGTILGTSRDKPHKILVDGKTVDRTKEIVAHYRRNQLDCLVCLGGNGTQKNAYRLVQEGLNVVTLPKTIDNDVVLTDTCFGYDTATYIATEAIDRLHTTATSHHRIIAVELMGHDAGWLALSAGIAGGADVILIPEIPYDIHVVAEFLKARRKSGKRFSIIAVAEGARAIEDSSLSKVKPAKAKKELPELQTKQGVMMVQEPMVDYIVRQLQSLTGIEARTTQLGHVQRGGPPTPTDRLICTRLGATAGELIAAQKYNVMVGVKADTCEAVPLEKVAGLIRNVPTDHSWIKTARLVGTCFGDRLA
jgi:6-phosphofructokinase 1